MYAIIPAMMMITLLVTVVLFYDARPTAIRSEALANDMARYHSLVLDAVPDPENIVGPISEGALIVDQRYHKKLADWRSEVVAVIGPNTYWLVTWPEDYPDGNDTFDVTDFGVIPRIFVDRDYDRSEFGRWRSDRGLYGVISEVDQVVRSDSVLWGVAELRPLNAVIPDNAPLLATRVGTFE